MRGAGRFSDRVTIKRPTETVNDVGERIKTLSAVASRWAEVKPLSGNERDYAARVAAELSYQVAFRTPLDIRQTDQVVWNSRTLEVAAVFDAPGVGEMMVQCKELV